MTRAKDGPGRFSLGGALSAGKAAELLGLLLLLAGLLLLLSVASYRPSDRSFLNRSEEATDTANLIGPVGADLAAAGFFLLGFAALLAPAAVLIVGYRLLRARFGSPAVLQWTGGVVVLLSVPVLVQLAAGEVTFRGGALAAGGFLGSTLAGAVGSRFGGVGAGLIGVAGLLLGLSLMLRSRLGDSLAAARQRLRETIGELKAAMARLGSRVPRRKRTGKGAPAAAAGDVGGESVADHLGLDLPAGVAPARSEATPRVTGAPSASPQSGPSPSAAAPTAPSAPARSPAVGFEAAELPPLDLLHSEEVSQEVDEEKLRALADGICSRLAEFGVEGTIDGISPGPVITVFEFQPAPGVKVSQIKNLADDLALSLKAEAIRIDPIPGRSKLGIEVPNRQRSIIPLGNLLSAPAFREKDSPLTMALGCTIGGEPYYADLAKMPHLLVAGATGAGKSVGLQGMLTSILYRASSDEVQFILIDPKRIELSVYADIPHLKSAVVVEPKQAANALRWAVSEMERRLVLLAEVPARSISSYNAAIQDPEVVRQLRLRDEETDEFDEPRSFERLPYYVVVIDELADLMMVAQKEVETSIARLAQMARAVGIHLIVATQRPSTDVLTGMIKANFPCRLSYAVASGHDSKTILDKVGAERLLGRGDMLFVPPDSSLLQRIHGAFVTERETAALVRWLTRQGTPNLDPTVLEPPAEGRSTGGGEADEVDALYDDAARLVVAEGGGSTSFLQRRMRVGFSRAARLVDLMEQDGILGPARGSKPREVLVPPDYFEEVDSAHMAQQ